MDLEGIQVSDTTALELVFATRIMRYPYSVQMQIIRYSVRFKDLTPMIMKNTVSWSVTTSSLGYICKDVSYDPTISNYPEDESNISFLTLLLTTRITFQKNLILIR
jgi:hypothetical protein